MKREHLIADWRKTIDAVEEACSVDGPRPCDACIATALELMARAASVVSGVAWQKNPVEELPHYNVSEVKAAVEKHNQDKAAGKMRVPVMSTDGGILGTVDADAMPQNKPGHEWQNLAELLGSPKGAHSVVWVSKTAARALLKVINETHEGGYVPGKDPKVDTTFLDTFAGGLFRPTIMRTHCEERGETVYLRIMESADPERPNLYLGIADRTGDGIMDTYFVGTKREEVEPWINK